MNDKPSQPPNLSRRDFGKLALGALGGLVAIEAAIVGLGYAAPRVGEGQFGSVITCGQVTEFPNGSVTPFNEGRFYLVRLVDGGAVKVDTGAPIQRDNYDPAQVVYA